MASIKIMPRKLEGKVVIPPSKSIAHRAIISAALSRGTSKIENVQYSKDIIATKDIMKMLGAKIEEFDDHMVVNGVETLSKEGETLDFQCNESGSTIRFLIPLALTKSGEYIFNGKGKLVSRPLNSYYEIFDEKGIDYSLENGILPLKVNGSLKSGEYHIRGDISSQFITGLLFSLPLVDGDSVIKITTNLESKGYVDLTLETLGLFGVNIENNNYKEFYIKGNQSYKPKDYYIEGDYSQAAFFLVAGAIGNDVECYGLREDSLQGDKAIIDILSRMGVKIIRENGYIKAVKSDIKGIEIDASQCPDIVPILAVLASLAEGETRIINAKRLRIKECDRLNATAEVLNKLGANIVELEDGLVIKGVKSFKGAHVKSYNDHRMAMAVSIAATRSTGEVILDEAYSITKSYPNFYEDYKMLGGEICDIDNR